MHFGNKLKLSRFESSGLNQHFKQNYESFSEYVMDMREIIEAARVDLTEDNRELIIDANSPYEWIPGPEGINPKTGRYYAGVLFLHGLYNTPYIYESLRPYFFNKHFITRALLLPGHGTVPGDLQTIDRAEWQKATKFAIESFKNQVDKLFLVGFSTGGLLAIMSAYDFSIDGLILLAPAVKMRTQFSIVSSINNFVTRSIGGITWYIKGEDNDYARYQSVTLEPAHQVHLLSRELSERAKEESLSVPIFMVCSSEDEVISESALIQFFTAQSNPNSRMIYYTNHFFESSDSRIIQLSSTFPEKRIISFSHVSLPIASDHPHYGVRGDYQENPKFGAIYGRTIFRKRTGEPEYYGALSRDSFKNVNVRRLTYNPDFNNMLNRIDLFIQNVIKQSVIQPANLLHHVPEYINDIPFG